MIGKPTHYSCLPQPIACYAAVVSNITKEYKAMTALLRSVVSECQDCWLS
jgi:hypothetical protein